MDREQKSVDVVVEHNAEQKVERTVEGGKQTSIRIRDICEGTHEFTITARDDQGATDSITRSAVFENAPPELEDFEVPKTQDEYVGAFPGGYMPASVEVADHRCSSASSPDPNRIGWSIDGDRIASGPRLMARLSPDNYSAGDTITLQAEFDDGTAVDRESLDIPLRSQPQGDQPLYAEITDCNVCDFVSYAADGKYSPNTVELEGRGVDPKTGSLSDRSLIWEAKPHGGARREVGRGQTATFELDEFFQDTPLPTETHTIYLTVEDDSGRTKTVQETFSLYIGG
jgi:hypothetical protein